MSGIRFVKFTETPDSHQAGIATIEFITRINLPNMPADEFRPFIFAVNYKVVAKKDSTGFFPAIASYKIAPEGPHNYLDCFELDSNSMKREIEQLIMEGFKSYYSKSTPSTFTSHQTNQGPNNLYGHQKVNDSSTQVKTEAFVESPLPF